MPTAPPIASPRVRSISDLLDGHARQHGRLIEILHELQDAVGYLRREDLLQVAHGLGLPPGRVLGVATFYPHFHLAAPARHRCAVCIGTACAVNGAAATGAILAVRLAGVSPALLSWELVSCVGACGVAPVVIYDGIAAARQNSRQVLACVEAWI
jgi:bidirectional [NiFe] hydrogenase diaphorase subunit